VPADSAAACQWWLKAATQGDAVTQLRLGEAYEAGRGVAKSLDEARRWYGEAALRGNAAAAAAVKRLAGGA
jgi:TPR repeat protein